MSCEGWIKKSLRRIGNAVVSRTDRRSASEPPKCLAAVNTEIAAAPPRA